MSYDVWLEADLGGPETVSVGRLDSNYTSNVGPMFYEAVGSSPSKWDGWSAEAVATLCQSMLCRFWADPAKYIAMNPENGWGNFEGAVAFIREIYDACKAAPRAIVRVWA